MARFLLAATSFAGHVVPLIGLAKALVDRGHEVLFYTGTKHEAPSPRPAAAWPFRQVPDFDDSRLDEAFPAH